jgi:bifunctional UDP-N-acetylglucosamine pyrophosphorylase/glucosamine-1-phosphate N-acetyltransferase
MDNREKRCAIVLAAGKSKRFQSEIPKFLHPLCGKKMLAHILDQLAELDLDTIFLVVGADSSPIREALSGYPIEFVVQEKQLGTGHAVSVVLPHLRDQRGSAFVLYADTPLITAGRLEKLEEIRQQSNAALALITSRTDDPTGYGRILRDSDGMPLAIIEEKDATPLQRELQETNPGVYCFDLDRLAPALEVLNNNNAQSEYYATDTVSILYQQGHKVVSVDAPSEEVYGINTKTHLAIAESILRQRIRQQWIRTGVKILQPESVLIDATVNLHCDVQINSGVAIFSESHLAQGCVLGPNTILEDAMLEAGVSVGANCVIRRTKIGKDSKVGPLSHIDNAAVGANVTIGDGTTTYNSDRGRESKIYIGDDVLVGKNCKLISPVTIQSSSTVADGATVSADIPTG